ncbi:MAG: hypothetical protein KGM42_02430 [Hyphomicrobiales bacterium]|nr:hypothetical protein [Hyphomicrobiales bacterium]
MSLALNVSHTRPARHFVVVGAVITGVGLLGAVIALSHNNEPGPKLNTRASFQTVQHRVIAPEPFAPRADVDMPIAPWKTGIAWNLPPSANASNGVSLAIAAKPVVRPKLATVAPLPPRRPATIAISPEGPPTAVATIEPSRFGGFHLRGLTPTREVLARGISGVRSSIGSVGEKIGDVGSSLGRMMRLSSR